MKVYVITKGEYSDYSICGVSLDREEAENIAKKCTDRYSEAEVEEYDTDDNAVILKYDKFFYCKEYDDGMDAEEKGIDSVRCLNVVDMWDGVFVNAENEEMAIKKASDILARHYAIKNDL